MMPSDPDSINFKVMLPEKHFVGRSRELSDLENAMRTLSSSTSNAIVVSGLGGIGKTQLVRKFVQKNRALYTNVIWINAEKSEFINESFTTLAIYEMKMSLNENNSNKDWNYIIEKVVNKLCCESKTLFVYDNVDDVDSIRFQLSIQPHGIKPDIIITSRIQKWCDGIQIMRLTVWEIDDAIEYVSDTLNEKTDYKDSETDKKILVEKLQYFPLALRQATAYINSQRDKDVFQIVDYVRIYDEQETLDSKIFQNYSLRMYEKTTLSTWSITIDAIERVGTIGILAGRILNIIAYFGPENIHREIFFHLNNDSEDRNDHREENIKSAVDLLINYSMVDSQEAQSVLSIHRLVQVVIKCKLEEARQNKSILRDALMLISKLIEVEYSKLDAIHLHLISVYLSALKFEDLVKEFSTLRSKILLALSRIGQRNQVKAFEDKCFEEENNILVERHSIAVLAMYNIAYTYRLLGRHSVACEKYEKIVQKFKKSLGENHPDTFTAQASLAFTYKDLGKHNEALKMYDDIFEKRKKVLGEYHQHTLATIVHIASTYRETGKHNKALQTYEEIIEKQKRILGEEHRDTLRTRSNMAFTYMEQGEHKEALQIFEEILQKQKNASEKSHRDILSTEANIANTYKQMGQHDTALQIFLEIFEKQKNFLGDDHRDTLTTLTDVADSCRQLGQHDRALEIFEAVFEKQKLILKENHIDTITTGFHIGVSCTQLGKHSEALQICQNVLEKQTGILGEDHQHTLKTRFIIALLLHTWKSAF